MRMLINLSFPHDVFNGLVKDGTAGAKMNQIVEATKPEAVYFTEQGNQRGMVMIVDLTDASKLPALVEPWMLIFQADIEVKPVMTPDDFARAGLDELGKKWA